ncbi:hypothetical protein [Crateriforma conspicua]
MMGDASWPQTIAALVIVITALAFVVRRVMRNLHAASSGSGIQGCYNCAKSKPSSTGPKQVPLVSLGTPARRDAPENDASEHSAQGGDPKQG